MLATYKYAVRKIATGKITWIMLLIGVCLSFGIAGYLPMTFRLSNYAPAERAALRLILAYTLGLGEVLILVIAVFAAFRAGSVFRDELQDGSFLIMLSKPIPRSSLVLAKWFAYLSSLVIFCLFLSAAHTLGVAAGSRFGESAERMLVGLGLVWAVGVVFAILFSGIALFLSTFLSSARTGAAVLALAFVFPASGLISQTQVNREWVAKGGRIVNLLGYVKPLEEGMSSNYEHPADAARRVIQSGKEVLAKGTPEQKRALFSFMDRLYELGVLKEPIRPEQATPEELERIVTQPDPFGSSRLANFFGTDMHVPSYEHDSYLSVLPVDFSGQGIALSHYLVDALFDPDDQNWLSLTSGGFLGVNVMRSFADKRIDLAMANEMLEAEALFSPPTYVGNSNNTAWLEDWKKWNEKFFADMGGAVYTIRYEPYHSQKNVLAGCLSVGGGLTLIAILLIKRKNFA